MRLAFAFRSRCRAYEMQVPTTCLALPPSIIAGLELGGLSVSNVPQRAAQVGPANSLDHPLGVRKHSGIDPPAGFDLAAHRLVSEPGVVGGVQSVR